MEDVITIDLNKLDNDLYYLAKGIERLNSDNDLIHMDAVWDILTHDVLKIVKDCKVGK